MRRGVWFGGLITALTATMCGVTLAGSAGAVSRPGLKATDGQPVQLVASGVMVPTSFASGDGEVFEGDSGNSTKVPNGGLFVLEQGTAKRVASKLAFVGGLDFHGDSLYVSGATLGSEGPSYQVLAFSGWNGTTFTTQKAIYTAPKGFQGFNGLAFGADGRLYVGVDTGLMNNNDHGPASTSPYLYDILSMRSDGSNVKVFASGIRQPWQLAFPSGSDSPFVSDFGQDGAATNPPDFLLRVRAGQDYGFPKCNQTVPADCRGYAKPLKEFAPHTDVGGVVIVGDHLYLGEFGFGAPLRPAQIVSLPLSGKGTPKPVISGVPASEQLIGLGASDGYLYFGLTNQNTGSVYKVKV